MDGGTDGKRWEGRMDGGTEGNCDSRWWSALHWQSVCVCACVKKSSAFRKLWSALNCPFSETSTHPSIRHCHTRTPHTHTHTDTHTHEKTNTHTHTHTTYHARARTHLIHCTLFSVSYHHSQQLKSDMIGVWLVLTFRAWRSLWARLISLSSSISSVFCSTCGETVREREGEGERRVTSIICGTLKCHLWFQRQAAARGRKETLQTLTSVFGR